MWQYEYSILTRAPHSTIWELWTQVDQWPNWNPSLFWAKLKGKFTIGSAIHLHAVGGQEITATITECEPYKGFVEVAHLPLATLTIWHEISEAEDMVKVTQRVEIKGPLAFLWQRIIGRRLEQFMPQALNRLAQTADAQAATPF